MHCLGVNASLVSLVFTFPDFTLKPCLLFYWHTGVIFDDRLLWPFLPTSLLMWSPVATSFDGLPLPCTSRTFPVSGLQELGYAPTSAGWIVVCGFSFCVLCCNFCHCKSCKDFPVNKNFAFLSHLWMEASLVSRISTGIARYQSPILRFLDLPFRVWCSTSLWEVEN